MRLDKNVIGTEAVKRGEAGCTWHLWRRRGSGERCQGRSGERQGPLACEVETVLNDVLNSLGVDSAPRKGRVFIGFIGVFGFFLVGKADLRFFVTAAPCATHVLFSSAQCSALERVIVERGSSRKIYEPTFHQSVVFLCLHEPGMHFFCLSY
ncbi:hypothetical protein BGY98DRAFT_171019 [Russula aff. rugulosa BPL654]|nr:hypothetical protein BGY98DRAFT_171019 [Russula aff. rugulosa BPL654]